MERLDSELLRTFLAVVDAGSFTGAAERIFRSQSAASLQIKRLETILGQPVFARHGRGVALSPAGERLEPAARQVVRLLDESLADLKGGALEGVIRIGIPDDYGKERLSKVVASFAERHPRTELIVHCALSAGFPEALEVGRLDLAVYEAECIQPGMDLLNEERTYWATSRQHAAHTRDPLPVALFDRDCWWRDVALSALRNSGRAYRVVYSSESVTGVLAAIEAGIAVGLIGESCLGDALAVLGQAQGFEATPTSKLVLNRARGADSEPILAMAAAVRQAFRGTL